MKCTVCLNAFWAYGILLILTYSIYIEMPEYWCQSEYSKNEIHTKPKG